MKRDRPGRVATTLFVRRARIANRDIGVLAALNTPTAATAARKAADLSLTLYRDGASSYLGVVTAQSTALEAERLAIALHSRQLVADIGLMLALGGAWTVPPEPPAKPGFAPYLAE